MVVCITSVRFTMKADILRQTATGFTPTVEGSWKSEQDPLTGEIIRRWIPIDSDTGTAGTQAFSMSCLARGVVSGGVQSSGTTEAWGEIYENIDSVRLWFPASKILSKRDRITNIRHGKTGQIFWIEEELGPTAGVFKPTIFEVDGVIPLFDPFGRHVENFAILNRADIPND